ncbi:MAG: DUF1302 domain-containing protein [Desulfobacterales bacterium]|nr:DUF1302 domain-containing protein [Desulfobacterales bacterium]
MRKQTVLSPQNYQKRSMKYGVSSILLTLIILVSIDVSALELSLGNLNVNFDTILSIGTSYRMEDRDDNLIGKANWEPYRDNPELWWNQYPAPYIMDASGKLVKNPSGRINYSPVENKYYMGTKLNAPNNPIPPGRYTTNGDEGNLNFDQYDPISQVAKGTSDMDMRLGNFGAFARVTYFYDYYILHHDFDRLDITDNKAAKRQHGANVELLDAFLYTNTSIADTPFALRIGKQVINWGENTFIQHGISEFNPIEVPRFRVPGAELKEALIPEGAVWTSLDLNSTIGLEAFYKFDYERTKLDGPGTYFSTNDFIADGGNYVQSGLGAYPDLRAFGHAGTIYPHVVERLADGNGPNRKEVDDQGQYGGKVSLFTTAFNATEFGFYFVNYHSKRPIISGYVHDGIPIDVVLQSKGVTSTQAVAGGLLKLGLDPATAQAMASGMSEQERLQIASASVDKDMGYDLTYFPGETFASGPLKGQFKQGWIKGFVEYPENIHLLGFSFNTVLPGGLSIGAEYSFRKDEPLQIDDVEMIGELSTPVYYSRGNLAANGGGTKRGIESQITPGFDPAPGSYIKGYHSCDVSQGQFTLTQMFSQMLGADSMTALVEIGALAIHDLPKNLRIDAPGTDRSGNPMHAGRGIWNGEEMGVETVSFADDFSMGYVLVGKLDYLNAFAGFGVSPRFIFTHDIYGTSPLPISLFVANSKSLTLSTNFEKANKYGIEFGYKFFWGGGRPNLLHDRDYAYLFFKLFI